ncbi:MAG: extracellular solute-binding protein [Candidatus Lustribacter sp.]
MVLRRREFMAGAAAAGAVLAGGAPARAAIDYRKPPEWAKLVQAAKQEGSLTLYYPTGDTFYAALVTRFEKAFPDIKVESTFGVGAALLTRLQAERNAGRYLADIWVNGSTVVLRGLKPQGGLVPLEPWLILPEVLDRNAWLQKMLWWNDGKAPNTNLSFAAIKYPVAYFNTNLAKASMFRSYWDLADPKWKGKVCSNDIRVIGAGGVPASYIFKDPSLGAPWFQKFFGTLDVTMGRDQRQLVDWLSQGRYAIAGFISAEEAATAMDQGLPIAPVNNDQLKEGGALGPGAGAVSVVDRAPHPNAAKLYVNWLLSREGQIAWQEETKYASLRVDVPKTNLILAPEPGKTYANGGNEVYGSVLAGLGAMVTDILAKSGAHG